MMKKLAIAATLSAALTITTVQAQTLQPQMSAQDLTADMQETDAGVLVPILAMIFIVLAGTGGGSQISASDSRLKIDIEAVGQTADGLTLYEFGYLYRDGRFRGVMAQEVLSHRPDAVITGPGGYLMVDYGALGLEMTRVD